jgi:hypothetical protein
METYNNSYTQQEDLLLWELHEIRHSLHIQRQHQTLEEINQQTLHKYAMWQQEREHRQTTKLHNHAK